MQALNNYRPYLGIEYQNPHGCLRLVEHVYVDLYNVNIENLDSHLKANDGLGLFKILQNYCYEVTEEQEGDVVLIRSNPWHVGLVIGDNHMIHSYHGGSSCIENYKDPEWVNKIEGFYRYYEW